MGKKYRGWWASDQVSAAVCEPLLPAGRRAEIETGFRRKIPGNTGEGAAEEPEREQPAALLDQRVAAACGGGRGSGANPRPQEGGALPPMGQGVPGTQGPKPGATSLNRKAGCALFASSFAFRRLHPPGEPSHRFGGVFLGHCSLGKNSFCFFAFTHTDLFLLLLLVI